MEGPPETTPPELHNHATVPEAVQHIETAVSVAAQQVGVGYVLITFGIFAALIQGFSVLLVFWLATMQQHRYITHLDFLPVLSVLLAINLVLLVAFITLWRMSGRR